MIAKVAASARSRSVQGRRARGSSVPVTWGRRAVASGPRMTLTGASWMGTVVAFGSPIFPGQEAFSLDLRVRTFNLSLDPS